MERSSPLKRVHLCYPKKKNQPILPIAIIGTTNALPKHSLNFHGFHKIQNPVFSVLFWTSAFAGVTLFNRFEIGSLLQVRWATSSCLTPTEPVRYFIHQDFT